MLWRALAALGAEGRWMVGDTASDVLAGRAAGLQTYAVCWSGQAADDLTAAAPDELAPDLDRLAELLP